MDVEEWGTVYNSSLVRIRASPDKTKFFIEIKEESPLDEHSAMVKKIAEALIDAGITSFNVDHIRWAGKQRYLKLDVANVRADFNILLNGKEILMEVKTEDTVLADSTRQQHDTLLRHKENVCLVVPKNMIKKADMMLKMCGLYPRIKLIAFEDLIKNPKMLEELS